MSIGRLGAMIWSRWTIFLWGAFKKECCANHPETIEALKHEIEVAIRGIEPQTIENLLENWFDRMGYCKVSRGSHLNAVMFYY